MPNTQLIQWSLWGFSLLAGVGAIRDILWKIVVSCGLRDFPIKIVFNLLKNVVFSS